MNNSSMLKKIEKLDSESINIANQNLKKIISWTKKPVYLYQDQQKEDIETFKDDLKSALTSLSARAIPSLMAPA